jgi:hypothetical protein
MTSILGQMEYIYVGKRQYEAKWVEYVHARKTYFEK